MNVTRRVFCKHHARTNQLNDDGEICVLKCPRRVDPLAPGAARKLLPIRPFITCTRKTFVAKHFGLLYPLTFHCTPNYLMSQ